MWFTLSRAGLSPSAAMPVFSPVTVVMDAWLETTPNSRLASAENNIVSDMCIVYKIILISKEERYYYRAGKKRKEALMVWLQAM